MSRYFDPNNVPKATPSQEVFGRLGKKSLTVPEMLERCHRGPEASAALPWLERAARQGHAAVRGAKSTRLSAEMFGKLNVLAEMTDTLVYCKLYL